MTGRSHDGLCWTLLGLYVAITVLRSFAPGLAPDLLQVALLTFLPLVFVFAHGLSAYRLRDLLVYSALTLVVSNVLENVSIVTGFPFGHYYYSAALGPKVLLVPILIGPAYLGTGYLSFVLARILLRLDDRPIDGLSLFTVPVLASVLMVSWDLSIDPIASTIEHKWIWLQGGHYFGVPLSNYGGWFLTVLVFFTSFVLYLRSRRDAQVPSRSAPARYLTQSVLFYAAIGLGQVLNLMTRSSGGIVRDATGALWRLRDIYVTCGLATIMTMEAFAILGLMLIAMKWRQPRTQ